MRTTALSIVCFIFFSACTVEWTEKEKEKVRRDCMLAADRFGFTDKDKHCDCVVRSVLNRYPSPNQFENMEMGEFGEIVAECQGREMSTRIIWPEKTQKAFVDSCISMAKSENKKEPENYCHCVLDELIRKYPTDDSLAGFSQKEMEQIGKMCERK